MPQHPAEPQGELPPVIIYISTIASGTSPICSPLTPPTAQSTPCTPGNNQYILAHTKLPATSNQLAGSHPTTRDHHRSRPQKWLATLHCTGRARDGFHSHPSSRTCLRNPSSPRRALSSAIRPSRNSLRSANTLTLRTTPRK